MCIIGLYLIFNHIGRAPRPCAKAVLQSRGSRPCCKAVHQGRAPRPCAAPRPCSEAVRRQGRAPRPCAKAVHRCPLLVFKSPAFDRSWQGGYRPPAPPLRAFGEGNMNILIIWLYWKYYNEIIIIGIFEILTILFYRKSAGPHKTCLSNISFFKKSPLTLIRICGVLHVLCLYYYVIL